MRNRITPSSPNLLKGFYDKPGPLPKVELCKQETSYKLISLGKNKDIKSAALNSS